MNGRTHGTDPSALNRSDQFETSKGYTLKIKGVSSFLVQDINRKYPLPEPPKYVAKTASGEELEFPHDPTTLSSDEDRAAWAQYKALLQLAATDQNAKLTELLLMEGLEIPEPPDGWVERMRNYAEVPTDPYGFRKFYIERELIGSASEAFELILAIMSRSEDVPEEAIRAVQDQFKSGMEEYKARITRNTIRQLELLKDARTSDHGKGLGEAP